MNKPGGNHNRASAAYRAFPYPGARSVAEIDAVKIDAKVQRELRGLMQIESANRLRPILRGDACAVAEIMTGRA